LVNLRNSTARQINLGGSCPFLFEQFPDMFVRVSRMFLGPSDSSKLEIQVKGPDADVIYSKAKELEALLRNIPGTTDIRNDWGNSASAVSPEEVAAVREKTKGRATMQMWTAAELKGDGK